MTVKNNSIYEIIVSSESPDQYSTKRLLVEAQKHKIKSQWVNPYQFFINHNSHKPKSGSLLFHRTSGTRYDDFDLLVSQQLENQNHIVTNPLEAIKLFRQKDQQAIFFNQNKLNSIPTISYRGELTQDFWSSIVQLSKKEKYILKMIRGNQGIGVNYIEGLKSLKSLLETFHALKDQRFIIQPFIEHKKEWRIFIIKGEVIATIEKTISAKDDFRGNSKRSIGKLIQKLPPTLEQLALLSFQHSKLDYAGIDILENGTGEYFILEINAIPGFKQVEELSKINIAKELIAGHF